MYLSSCLVNYFVVLPFETAMVCVATVGSINTWYLPEMVFHEYPWQTWAWESIKLIIVVVNYTTITTILLYCYSITIINSLFPCSLQITVHHHK